MDKKKREKRMRKVLFGTVALVMSIMVGNVPVTAEAATSAQKEQVKQIMIDMYYSVDTSSHNMLRYSLTTDEFNVIYAELQRGEHERMIGSYEHFTKLKSYSLGKRVTTIKLVTEDYDVLERYKKVNANADAILAGIEPEMDDLDKVIYLHDAIVEHVTYNKNAGDQRYTLGGALGEGNAVCLGYAEALNLLLKETGFETDCVISDSVNHAWSYVKLDGEWYHVDPTWDDTRSAVRGQTSRQFMLRNDAEFEAGGNNSHGADMECEYGAPASSSTKYSNWFMHNVIGKMAFEDGLWYFVDPTTKDIVRADADGSGYETVIKYTGTTLAVVDMEGTVLIYTEGGKSVVRDISVIEDGNEEIEDGMDEENESLGGITLPEEERKDEAVIEPENGNNDGVVVGPEKENNGEIVGEPEKESSDEDFTCPDLDKEVMDDVNTEAGTPVIGFASLQGVNLNEYMLWCAGKYNAQGKVEEKSGYFSTVNCYLVQPSVAYTVTMKDTRFRIVLCEYALDGRLVAENELGSDTEHVMSGETAYVGLTTYMPAWPGMPQEEFNKKLQYELHTIEFVTTEEKNKAEQEKLDAEKIVIVSEVYLEEAELNAVDIWCEGKYNGRGKIEEATGYFSTVNAYKVQSSGKYKLTLVDTRFDVFVYEYTEDGRLVAETKLHSGDTYIMNAETAYVGVAMYMPVWFNMPWNQFVKKLNYEWKTTGFVLQ